MKTLQHWNRWQLWQAPPTPEPDAARRSPLQQRTSAGTAPQRHASRSLMRGCPTRVPRGARVHPRSQILSQAQIEPPELPLAQCVLTAPRSALDVYSPHPDPCAPPQVNSFEEFRNDESCNFLRALMQDSDNNLGLLFSCDSASRNNPGSASCGIGAWRFVLSW